MRSRAFLALAALGGALVTGGWLLRRGLVLGAAPASAQLFDDVLDHVARLYVDSIPRSALYTRAAEGMVQELHDPYSAYLDPAHLQRLNESTGGTYAGLGVQIDLRDGWITIIAPLPGSPAARAGIQPGDRIVAVNGRSTEGWNADEASEALRGRPGSTVALTVQRPGVGDPLPFTVERADIHVRSVRYPTMLTPQVGYVDLSIFSESTDDELRNAIGELRRKGMTTLILDLRENPGGLLEQGVRVADLFLDAGQTIVSMRGRAMGATHDFVDEARQAWPGLDVIALVDGHSASAAEIVAGALQDHDRGVIVGTTTYGKGSAQTVLPLDDGAGALKLTTARWYTPSGRSIQKAPADTTSGDDPGAPAPPAAPRREYHTDDGRVVYGGGGITPDLVVPAADSGDGLLGFWRMLGPDVQRFRDALTETALAVKGAHGVSAPDFAVTASMREDLWRRLAAKHVGLDRARYAANAAAVNRLLGDEIARFVFGPEAAFEREVRNDAVIAAALRLATGAASEHELLMRAARVRAPAPAVPAPAP